MVARSEIVRMAMSYDTQMARAFRQALCIECAFWRIAHGIVRMADGIRHAASDAYDGIEECMAEEDEPGAWREARANRRRQ